MGERIVELNPKGAFFLGCDRFGREKEYHKVY
jgi:hypothetical protein